MLKIIKLIEKKYRLAIIALLLTIYTVCNLALPTLMSKIVDDGINQGDFRQVWILSVIMIVFAIVGVVTYYFGAKIICSISAEFFADMRCKMYKKVLSLPYTTINKYGVSGLLTRCGSDIWVMNEILSNLLSGVVIIPVYVIGGTILSFSKDIFLSLILLAFAPVLICAVFLIAKRVGPLWKESDEYIDKQNLTIRERFSGIRVIRALGTEEKEQTRVEKATKIMANKIIKGNVMMGLIFPLAELVLNVVTVLILYIGMYRMTLPSTAVSAGDIVAVVQYVSFVMAGVINLSWVLVLFPKAGVSANRVLEILHEEEIPAPTDLDLPQLEGNIEFKNFTFTYPDSSMPAVNDINISIRKGEEVAFIGGTGSGKSTVINALLGIYPIERGELFFDGIDYNDISGARIQQNLSIVLQKSKIFAGSIKDNILVGRNDITDEKMWEALDIACIKDFVVEQAEKENYLLTQEGTNISGGQKQRISIARALLKDAPINVYDDSFSALDFITEARLRAGLRKKTKGKTKIIVTQRVTSAMSANRIYVFDGGEIVGSGSHDELLKNCKIYREIYRSQTGRALDD